MLTFSYSGYFWMNEVSVKASLIHNGWSKLKPHKNQSKLLNIIIKKELKKKYTL